MNRVTPVPNGRLVPAAGSVPVASPALQRLELWLSMRATFRWACSIVFLALVSLSPWTDGTGCLPGPVDTVRVTVEPLSAFKPALGFSPITTPAACELGTEIGEPTVK